MDLSNWTLEHIKAQNAFAQTLLEHKKDGDVITCTHKHKTHHYLIAPTLKTPTATDHYTVVCNQTPTNVQFLIDNWKEFLQQNLTVLFVNPESNQFWKIKPLLHNTVADPDNLEQGIQSLASAVPAV